MDKTALENLESDIPKAVTRKKDDSNVSNFILTTRDTEAVVQVAKLDSKSAGDGDIASLSNLVAKKIMFGNGTNVLKRQH